MRNFAILGAAALLSACATTPVGLMPTPVMAVAETEPVGTVNEDAADDPAIWRNAANPAASLIVATDKKAGLYVYGLDGAIRSFNDAGAVNNVDLVELADGSVFVAASDRADLLNSHIATFMLDTATGELTAVARIPSGPGEGYGFCLSQHDGLSALAVTKEGRLAEYALTIGAGTVSAQLLREMSVPSQPEGCVFDDRDGTLYVGEENGGIWRFADGASTGEMVAAIDNQYLVADVEGLAIAPQGANGGYLVASSQGDNAYAVYRLPDYGAARAVSASPPVLSVRLKRPMALRWSPEISARHFPADCSSRRMALTRLPRRTSSWSPGQLSRMRLGCSDQAIKVVARLNSARNYP